MVEGDLFRLKEAFDEGNTIVARGYHNLKLKSNPFPPDGLAPDDNLLPSSAETLEKIGEFVRQFLRTKRYQGLVVLGTYGMGKTHTLKLIREQMQRSQLPLKAVYLLTPGYEPYQMLRGVLRELGQGEVTKWLWNIALKQIIADYRDSPTVFMNQFVPNVRSGRGRAGAPQPALFQLKPFGIEALSDYRTFLDAFDAANLSRDRLRDYIVGVFKEHISEDLGVVGEFTNMLIYDQYKSYASWQNLTVQGAGNSIFKPEGEATFLLALLKVLKANGFEYLMILIDEFEGISLMKRMTRREAIQYLYALSSTLALRRYAQWRSAWENKWRWEFSHFGCASRHAKTLRALPATSALWRHTKALSPTHQIMKGQSRA